MTSQERAPLDLDTALRVACHEAGHAVVAWHGEIYGEFSVRMPTRASGRGTLAWDVPTDPGMRFQVWLERTVRGRPDGHRLGWDHCAVMLGGLAGEGVGLRTVRTKGAESDIVRAHDLAENIVHRSATDPPWDHDTIADTRIDVSRMFSSAPSPEVSVVLNACYGRARRLIKAHEGAFSRLVVRLLRDWHVDHFELSEVLGER